MLRNTLVGALAILALAATVSHALSERRIALVIGNSAYEKTSPLANPKNDARLIGASLSAAGFETTTHVDLTWRDMKRALRDFSTKIAIDPKDTIALFYFAGHGLQVEGTNYLVPVDAQIGDESDVSIESLRLNDIIGAMESAGPSTMLVVLDACRNNPYRSSFRSATRGLARVDAPTGSLIAYATSPGDVAADGIAENSPFTAALAGAMRTPDLPIEQVFKSVRKQVHQATGGKQTPWESSSLTRDFYFHRDGETVPPPPPPTDDGKIGEAPDSSKDTESQAARDRAKIELAYLDAVGENTIDSYKEFLAKYPSSPQAERVRAALSVKIDEQYWNGVLKRNTISAYEEYLSVFPNGVRSDEAKKRIATLKQPVEPPPVKKPAPQETCGHPHGPWRVSGIKSWDYLAMRSAAGKNNRLILKIPYNASGLSVSNCKSVSGYSYQWCRVAYKCYKGWSSSRYLAHQSTGARPGSGQTPPSGGGSASYRVAGVANWDVLNVRSGPSTKYRLVGELPYNASQITILSCRNVAGSSKWCRLRWRGLVGWASSKFLVDRNGRRP